MLYNTPMVIMGTAIADQILDTLRVRVYRLKENHDITPHVAVIRVGNDPAITSYINQKKKMATAIGALLSLYQFQIEVSREELLETIQFLQSKGNVHGIILQLPLPAHLDAEELLMAIDPEKDIDGFTAHSPFTVPLAAAVMTVLEHIYEHYVKKNETTFMSWLKTKAIVVLGKGKTAGGPVIELLHKFGIKHAVIDRTTIASEETIKHADIVISATGKQHLITRDAIKQNAILIGIGLSRGEDGILQGDYDEEDIAPVASFYTPTPKGVGPVNVAKLMENLVLAAERSLAEKHIQ